MDGLLKKCKDLFSTDQIDAIKNNSKRVTAMRRKEKKLKSRTASSTDELGKDLPTNPDGKEVICRGCEGRVMHIAKSLKLK